MPNIIEVTISPTTFKLATGEAAEATATLRNLGQTVDQLTLKVDGLEPAWYTLPVSSVALFPKDKDNLKIILHPPKGTETKAGNYPFRVNVTSQERPEEITTVNLAIEVRALPGLELEISPQRIIGRRGTYQIVVKNQADQEARLSLQARADQGGLCYAFTPEQISLQGSSRAEVTLKVRLKWLAWFGGEKEFAFKVIATPPGIAKVEEEGKTVEGRFVRVPWYKVLPQVRLPWLARLPKIVTFKATTEDKRDFKITWAVKRAIEIKINEEFVAPSGEKLVHPTEKTTYVLTASNKTGSVHQSLEAQPPPPLGGKVSEKIRVILSPPTVQAFAGGAPAPAYVTVQNLGGIVDKFSIALEGIDEAWYTRSASSLALFPQASEQLQITFHLPKKKGVKSGVYPFAVNVSSQSAPSEITSTVGQLEILPSAEFQLKVQPMRVLGRSKGSYRVNLINTGVTDITFALDSTDLEEGCHYLFRAQNPVLPAWTSTQVPMTVKPKRGSLIGERKQYDITVTAIGAGSSLTATAQLIHQPFISSWKAVWRVVKTLIVLGVAAIVIYFLLNLGGGLGNLIRSPQTWLSQLIANIERWFAR